MAFNFSPFRPPLDSDRSSFTALVDWVNTQMKLIAQALAELAPAATPSPNTIVVPSDVVNSTFASFVTSGLSLAVTAGTVYVLRFTLFGSYTSTGGISVRVTHPTLSARRTVGRRNISAVNAFSDFGLDVNTASPLTDGFVLYSGEGWATYTITLIPSADGTVDLTFSPGNGSQTATIHAGSMLEWWTP